MAVITDLGNTKDIHPNEKEFVAKRLAVHALRKDYGFSGIKSDSPAFKSLSVDGARMTVRFRNAEKLYIYNKEFTMATGFELAGTNGVWKPAKVVNLKTRKWSNGKEFKSGEIEAGDSIVLEAEGVDSPSSVRYLHSSPWFGSVYNEVDLPLGPFHAGR
jgi:sialate O-acetylesterase